MNSLSMDSRPAERRKRLPDPRAQTHPLIRALLARMNVSQPVLLVGDRLNGRSLFIEAAIHPQVMRDHGYDPNEFLIAWITGGDIPGLSVESFWMELVLPQFREEARLVDPSMAALIEEAEHEGAEFGVDEALYRIRKKLKRKPLIAWDGLEVVPGNENLDKWFFAQLRAFSQTYDLSFLIGSSKPFEDFTLWTVSTSPFFNIFYTVDMERVELAF